MTRKASKLPEKKPTKLSARRERFVAEYLIDLNATQAAIRAGYAPKDADVQGPRLLGIVGVAEAIAAAKAKRLSRTEITQARVLEELSLLAFSDLTHFQNDAKGNVSLTAEAPAGAMRALQSVKKEISTIVSGDENPISVARVEIKLWDKPGMLKLAGRHVGLFPDRVELVGPGGGPLQIETSPKTSADLRRELAELTTKPDGSVSD